jgi:hypothetical protein
MANPQLVDRLNTVAVGDLVMVMGQVEILQDDNTMQCTPGRQLNTNSSDTTMTPQNNTQQQLVYCIQARLIQNVTRTNMTLHVNALKARRKHLYQQRALRLSGSPSLQNAANTTCSRIMGCGPPPYDELEPSWKSDSSSNTLS